MVDINDWYANATKQTIEKISDDRMGTSDPEQMNADDKRLLRVFEERARRDFATIRTSRSTRPRNG